MLPLVLAALLAADAAPAPAPPPAALDSVFLANGGRARGSVIEDDPTTGVLLQLPDGSFRRFPRADVLRVQYAGEQAPPPAAPPVAEPPQSYPPPPMAAPPAPPAAQPVPFEEANAPAGATFALGLSGAGLSGSVSDSYGSTSNWFGGFGQLDLEGGVRVTPAWTLLLQLDLGAGGTGGPLGDYCSAHGLECAAGTVRFGVAARYAFTPFARSTPWISLGLGREGTAVSLKGPSGTESVGFGGWEWLKLGLGWDLRFSRQFGLGAFLGYALGSYATLSSSGPGYLMPAELGSSRTHAWWMVGARAILFP